MNLLTSSMGSFKLTRWPPTSDRSLRAWDAADELLIEHVHTLAKASSSASPKLLICNDVQGALSCALHSLDPVSWSDSSLSHTAMQRNWASNSLPGKPAALESTRIPEAPVDIVLIKVPKTLALLEDQLATLKPLLHEGSVVVAASMLKYLSRTVFLLFEKYIGPVQTSLAVKKARLIFCTPDPGLPVKVSPFPDQYTDNDLDLSLLNHANVFCRDRVDLGSRLFIEHMKLLPQSQEVVDLACGNGILGLCLQRLQPDAKLTFIDESYHAIASARENHATMARCDDKKTRFLVGNGLQQIDAAAVDLVVCNPPFHAQHALTGETTRAFVSDAARCLRHTGQLWVVANRHLPYHNDLKQHFRQLDIKAQNRRFTLYCASDPRQQT